MARRDDRRRCGDRRRGDGEARRGLPPSRVLFVGTCGAYDGRIAVGDLLAVRAAIATSLDELEGRAHRPSLEPVRYGATWTIPGLPAHGVAVPPAITWTAEGAARLAAVAAAEHFEFTGVLAACRDPGAPVAAALASRTGSGRPRVRIGARNTRGRAARS